MLDGEGKERFAHVRDDEILLDVHKVVDRDGPQFRELLSAFLEELRDRVALLALPGWRTKGFRIRIWRSFFALAKAKRSANQN